MKTLNLAILISLIAFACGGKKVNQVENKAASSKMKVAVVNYPLYYFTERIAGEGVEILFPIDPEGDPAFWEPSVDALSQFQNADVIFLNGAGYAKWLSKVTLPSSRLVNTSAAIEDQYIEVSEGVTHSHGPEGEHEHKGYAFTTWLDPSIAKIHAQAIYDYLKTKMPDQEETLTANFNALHADLDQLEVAFEEGLSNQKVYYGSHPVYQYLARAFDVEIHEVHWEPGVDITNDQWHELEHIMDHHPANVMLWEGEPSAATRKRLEDAGVAAVVFDPCGNVPEEGDFIDVMQSNLAALSSPSL